MIIEIMFIWQIFPNSPRNGAMNNFDSAIGNIPLQNESYCVISCGDLRHNAMMSRLCSYQLRASIPSSLLIRQIKS